MEFLILRSISCHSYRSDRPCDRLPERRTCPWQSTSQRESRQIGGLRSYRLSPSDTTMWTKKRSTSKWDCYNISGPFWSWIIAIWYIWDTIWYTCIYMYNNNEKKKDVSVRSRPHHHAKRDIGLLYNIKSPNHLPNNTVYTACIYIIIISLLKVLLV